MPDTATKTPGMSGEQVDFLGQVLGANARWSASIHTTALDGQERASNEWAQRYLSLATRLEHILDTTDWFERDTELFRRLGLVAGSQSFYPNAAADQIVRYEESLAKRAEEEKR